MRARKPGPTRRAARCSAPFQRRRDGRSLGRGAAARRRAPAATAAPGAVCGAQLGVTRSNRALKRADPAPAPLPAGLPPLPLSALEGQGGWAP